MFQASKNHHLHQGDVSPRSHRQETNVWTSENYLRCRIPQGARIDVEAGEVGVKDHHHLGKDSNKKS